MTDATALVEQGLVDHFGHRPTRASVSFVGVDPIEVLRFEPSPGEYAYVSLGMCRSPMTGADEPVLRANGPRGELLLRVRRRTGQEAVWRGLAVLAAAPAVEGVVHRDGATVDLGAPLAPGSHCTGVVVSGSDVPAVSVSGGASADAAEVDILQVLPATAHELAWARAHGSAALRTLWVAQNTPLGDLARPGVTLPAAG